MWEEIGVLVAVIVAGAVGGFLNALLIGENRLQLPRRIPPVLDEGHKVDFGFFGNILFGAGGGFISYALGLGVQRPSVLQQVGIALTAGLGGASFVTNWVQKGHINLLDKEVDRLGGAVKRSTRR